MYEQFYLVAFWLEMSVQLGLFGTNFFGDMYAMFDIGVFIISVVPYGMATVVFGPESPASLAFSRFTIARLLRLLRAVSVVRYMSFFREFWILVRGLTYSFRVLIWGVSLAFLIIFMFAIPATTYLSAGEQFQGEYHGWYMDMNGYDIADYTRDKFGTLPRTMQSLFNVMTLDAWVESIDMIIAVAPGIWWFFVTFVAIGCFAFLNLLTAIIVESALNYSKDEEQRIDMENNKTRVRIQHRIEKFTGKQVLTKAEYISILRTQPRIQRLLRSFGCHDVDDVHSICDILADPDDPEHKLPIREFLVGIQRFKTGQAKSKDLLEALSRLSILENLVRRHHITLKDMRQASKRNRQLVTADLNRLQDILDSNSASLDRLIDALKSRGLRNHGGDVTPKKSPRVMFNTSNQTEIP